LKLLDLENRSKVLPWQERYQYVRTELQKRGILDWRNHLLVMVKESLKLSQDKEAVLYMTNLSEFEQYFCSTYIVGQNLVQDLLSRLFNKQKPVSYEESISNIMPALNGMKILKTKKLEKNVTDIQLEMIMTRCLLKSDQQEYFRDWAKERGTSILSSTFLETEDEDIPLDFDKTISDEIDCGTMEVTRDFLE